MNVLLQDSKKCSKKKDENKSLGYCFDLQAKF